MLILRTLQRSRAAITSMSGAPASSNSLCHFRPRAIAATSLIRASDRMGLLSTDPVDDGRTAIKLAHQPPGTRSRSSEKVDGKFSDLR